MIKPLTLIVKKLLIIFLVICYMFVLTSFNFLYINPLLGLNHYIILLKKYIWSLKLKIEY